jgi:hypothetical protein
MTTLVSTAVVVAVVVVEEGTYGYNRKLKRQDQGLFLQLHQKLSLPVWYGTHA